MGQVSPGEGRDRRSKATDPFKATRKELHRLVRYMISPHCSDCPPDTVWIPCRLFGPIPGSGSLLRQSGVDDTKPERSSLNSHTWDNRCRGVVARKHGIDDDDIRHAVNNE